MRRVFGIETEYGITRDGEGEIDVVHESIEIVRSYRSRAVSMKWDYDLEDPHQDVRGFRAKELLQDTDEAAYFEADQARPLSFEEIKSDLVLANGARFYNDHAHPEYSTPECSTLAELVAQDQAGERILCHAMRQRNATLPEGQKVRLYKNNTDFQGHSFGCHDNYLIPRTVPWEAIVEGMIPFLVTRQIFAGTGKLGVEGESRAATPGVYQISQRSDFLSVLVSIDTMNRRPIINTRDEPHADPERYRRFHCIIGDANMNGFATALKVGTTALVLELIEAGVSPLIKLADPVKAARDISLDPERRWIIRQRNGQTLSAIDLQRLYLAAAQQHCDPTDPDVRWILTEWEAILDDLDTHPARCLDRVDWLAKEYLLNTFREEERLSWDDPWLQSLDLEYHNIDPEVGLFPELVQQCLIRRFVSDEAVAKAIQYPPETTRAYFRGRAVARFREQIASIQWDEVVFHTAQGPLTIPLDQVADDAALRRLNAQIDLAPTPDGLVPAYL